MAKSIMNWLSLLLCTLAMMNQVCGQNPVNYTLLESAVPNGAVCLDGSPPAYAYLEGYAEGANNWLVLMEGGGWCESQTDCLNRSKRYFGSSHNVTIANFTGILDSHSQFNPQFYNWHRVFMHYCDGSVYSSNIEQVDPITNVTYRGARIFNAIMEEMLRKGMRHAQNAILSGGSAGGLSTILHCDGFRALFPNTSRVKCISDSGFFIRGEGELANLSSQHFAQVIATHQLAPLLPTSCTSKRDPNLCLFPEYLVGDVTTPLFLVESAFDSFQIIYNFIYTVPGGGYSYSQWKNCSNDLAQCNSTEIAIIKDFRPIFIETLLKLDKSSTRGMFINSCYLHTHITKRYNWICSPVLHNNTIAGAIGDWFFDRSGFEEIEDNACPQRCDQPPNPMSNHDTTFCPHIDINV